MKIETKNGIFTTEIEEVENKYVKDTIKNIIERNKGYEVLNMTVKDDDPELSPEDEDFGIMSWEVILFNGEEIKLYSSDLDEPESFTDTDDETFCLDLDYLMANVFVEEDSKKIFDALRKLYFLTCSKDLDKKYEEPTSFIDKHIDSLFKEIKSLSEEIKSLEEAREALIKEINSNGEELITLMKKIESLTKDLDTLS